VSSEVPKQHYVYQPYGSLDSYYADHDRLWGVGFPTSVPGGALVTIKGLTSLEAHVVRDALRTLQEEQERDQ